jgi:hypothetical protein
MSNTPPEQLSERELFTEYVELLKQREISGDAYEEVTLHKRQACLLAEIGERLEALEAAKALLHDTNEDDEMRQHQTDQERQFNDPHRLSFDDE